MVTQLLVCDVGKEKSDDIFYVQGEKGRELIFDVINSFLDSSPTLSGYTATIHILKSDGNFTIANMTIDVNNKLHYTLTENDCAVSGNGIYDISLTKNNELIYSSHGYYIGDSRAVSDDVVNSVSVAYGVTFPEGFQEKLTAGDNITISENNVISAAGKEYHEGTGIDINNDIIAIDESILVAISNKQDELTAGDNISIENNVISSKGIDIVTIHYGAGDNTLYRTFTLPDERIPKFFIIKGYMDIGWYCEIQGKFGDPIIFGSCSNILPYNQQLGGNDTVTYDLPNKQYTIHGYNAGYTFNTSSADFDITYIYF